MQVRSDFELQDATQSGKRGPQQTADQERERHCDHNRAEELHAKRPFSIVNECAGNVYFSVVPLAATDFWVVFT